MKKGIVAGQRVEPVKAERARELRRSMTPAEARLWEHLRRNRVAGHHFRRQQVIDGFIVDFYCHMGALVVEVDGAVHDGQREYDAERDRVLSGRGLKILRFTNDQVEQDLDGVLEKIRGNLTPRPLP